MSAHADGSTLTKTIAMLGVDLGAIATFGTLKAALQHCITQERRALK